MVAEVTANVSIAIEANIHNSLRNAIQSLCNQYNVRVEKVNVSWDDFSSMGCKDHQVKEVVIVSTSF